MAALFSATLPVFFIALLGYLAQRLLKPDVPGLVRLVLYFFVPFLVMEQITKAASGGAWIGRFALAYALTYLSRFLLAHALGWVLGLAQPLRKTLVASAVFPNSGNMGLSVALFALGQAGLERAVVYFLLSTVVLFGFGPALFRGGGVLRGLGLALRLPFVWALFFGFGLIAFGLSLPVFLERAVGLLGSAAIPLLLMTLGMQIAQTSLSFGGFELVASALRLLLAPATAFLVGSLVGLRGLELAVLTMISGMPVAVNSYMLAVEFGGDGPRAARAVAVSTLLSFFTVPAVIWVLGRQGFLG